MHVLVVTSCSDRSQIALYNGLVKAGIDIDLVCDPAAPEQQALSDAGISVSQLIIRHRLDFHAVRNIRKKLNKKNYDMIYAPENKTLSVSLLASQDVNVKHIAYRGTIGHLSRWDPASWLTYFNPRIDRIICVSDAVRQYLLSMHLPPSRLVTIYKGHDVSWYAGSKSPSLSSEFGIPCDAFVVGFVGNMRPVKGVDILIQSAFHLPEHLEIHFLLVGEVRDRKIKRLASDKRICDRIHFAGFRKDAPALTGACNVFVMPSIAREGLPRAVIEAMSQDVPVIVSNVGGMPEIVDDHNNGLIVPPRDPEALARAIMYFAEDPSRCRLFGEQARKKIETHFSIEMTIKQTTELYREVLGH